MRRLIGDAIGEPESLPAGSGAAASAIAAIPAE
jgi:hypothetical protein